MLLDGVAAIKFYSGLLYYGVWLLLDGVATKFYIGLLFYVTPFLSKLSWLGVYIPILGEIY